MSKVSAVILAAGLSKRMGKQNKLLLPVAGKPMIARTLDAYIDTCDEVVVVTGFEAGYVAATLRHLDLRTVHNPDFAVGQATSVAIGLRTVFGADHVVVGLADQPWLCRRHLSDLIRIHIDAGGKKITVPYNGEDRGNPIIIPGSLVPALLQDDQNPGCAKFTRTRPDLVDLVPCSEHAYFKDVDTPADYAAISTRVPTAEEAHA